MAQSYSSQSMIRHVKPEINLTDLDLLYLRERCDKYQDKNWCVCPPAWVTEFDVEREHVRDAAKLALNVYNQKEQKNFNLEKVSKLNYIGTYLCMTFRAKNAETEECCLFRGVVDGLSDTVYLSEIKKPDGIAILSDLANHVEALSVSKEDHCPYTWEHATIEKDLGGDFVDNYF
ncbi:uncharacterized protein [Primulina huaijiensis]|uniref:uncharacterized protein isoform X3 n=1 Tax=Primulina huaijiensis TaxID=1492673 RepID=UPI003CC71C82